mmetsp:Transcript_58704/g.128931  ORF Transcript_58704/g.128931 Transcript_58704/m.128931 type:complete len:93 (-) Transcript_58704:71-349(-)
MASTSTNEPTAMGQGDNDGTIFGFPTWAFGALVGLIAFFCIAIPLLYWLRRQVNLRRAYVPDTAPDINGFVKEVVDKATSNGTLRHSRIDRT